MNMALCLNDDILSQAVDEDSDGDGAAAEAPKAPKRRTAESRRSKTPPRERGRNAQATAAEAAAAVASSPPTKSTIRGLSPRPRPARGRSTKLYVEEVDLDPELDPELALELELEKADKAAAEAKARRARGGHESYEATSDDAQAGRGRGSLVRRSFVSESESEDEAVTRAAPVRMVDGQTIITTNLNHEDDAAFVATTLLDFVQWFNLPDQAPMRSEVSGRLERAMRPCFAMREKATKKKLYSRSRLAKAAVASAAKDVKLDLKRVADGREKCENARARCFDRSRAEHCGLVDEVKQRMDFGEQVWKQARDKLDVWHEQYRVVGAGSEGSEGAVGDEAFRLLGDGGGRQGSGFDGLSATLSVLLA